MAEDKSKPKKPRKAKGSSDRASEKLADTRVLLEEQEAKSADALAFVHAVMCQIGLPRSGYSTNNGVFLRSTPEWATCLAIT